MDSADFKQYKNLVYNIIGAAMTVHNELNWGNKRMRIAGQGHESSSS